MSDASYILVVDDDVDILDALWFMLEDEGHQVQTSEKGDYAESLHESNGGLPDLNLLDVLLSGKDGRAICRKLKSQDETRHIPIVMLSAHPDAEHSVKAVGADAFVARPLHHCWPAAPIKPAAQRHRRAMIIDRRSGLRYDLFPDH